MPATHAISKILKIKGNRGKIPQDYTEIPFLAFFFRSKHKKAQEPIKSQNHKTTKAWNNAILQFNRARQIDFFVTISQYFKQQIIIWDFFEFLWIFVRFWTHFHLFFIFIFINFWVLFGAVLEYCLWLSVVTKCTVCPISWSFNSSVCRLVIFVLLRNLERSPDI